MKKNQLFFAEYLNRHFRIKFYPSSSDICLNFSVSAL